jgi:hypothetical protein
MRKNVQRRIETELTPAELREAEVEVIRTAQQESFSEEYRNLTARKPVSPKSQLVN